MLSISSTLSWKESGMSVVIVIDCPYCPAENSTFLFQHGYQMRSDAQRAYIHWMLFRCPRCSSGVTVRGVSHKYGVSPEQADGDVHDLLRYVEHFPKRAPIAAPGGLPPVIERLYIQAGECFQRKALDAACMTIRKTLEVALREKFGDFPGSLSQHIQTLKIQHLLTDELAAWADEIRIDGNEAVHEAAEPDWENTWQMKEFLHVFLLYAFTLPAMIEQRKNNNLI
jgi:hypothetical protein